ncbi:hypothetical protein Ae331Ps2_6119 [Pseudonocardia sp. Ae331_Ps2]|nr:hypothetical protein Ae331Ps2_6119 [Pseudonocardia sp. Ae331_Ps2]
MWFGWFDALIVKVRSGPNWASIGFAHEAEVGVKHNSTLCQAAHARIFGVLFAERLSRMT